MTSFVVVVAPRRRKKGGKGGKKLLVRPSGPAMLSAQFHTAQRSWPATSSAWPVRWPEFISSAWASLHQHAAQSHVCPAIPVLLTAQCHARHSTCSSRFDPRWPGPNSASVLQRTPWGVRGPAYEPWQARRRGLLLFASFLVHFQLISPYLMQINGGLLLLLWLSYYISRLLSSSLMIISSSRIFITIIYPHQNYSLFF